MIDILTRKFYLKDLLEGFVDIHCHILPGIDDGSKSIQESLVLIKNMQELGIQQCIATPHVMHDFYPNDEISIGNAFQNLIEALTKHKQNDMIINPSAEYMMDVHFETLVNQNNIFPLKQNYVLVEMSYFQPPINLEVILHQLTLKGYIPVLAHPERYSFYHHKKEYYKTLKSLGCLFQLNLLSLSDHYGKSVQKTAQYLIDEGLIDFTATDAHNEKHLEKLSKMALNKSQKQGVTQIIENTKNNFLVS